MWPVMRTNVLNPLSNAGKHTEHGCNHRRVEEFAIGFHRPKSAEHRPLVEPLMEMHGGSIAAQRSSVPEASSQCFCLSGA
jgi:hypothetical protein